MPLASNCPVKAPMKKPVRTEEDRENEKFGYGCLFVCGSFFTAFTLLGLLAGVAERDSQLFFGSMWFGAFAWLFFWTGRAVKRSSKERDAEEERARDAAAAAQAAIEEAEQQRIRAARARRDADSQELPYYYKVGRHANETLALRYGIANLDIRSEPDTAHVRQMLELGEDPPVFSKRRKSGEAGWIALRKIRKAGIQQRDGTEGFNRDAYLVELSHFRDREALAVIEPGTDYVKTFLPLKQSWFRESHALEEVLKGNATMPLQDIAKFHVATKLRRASPYSEPRERSGRRPSE